MNDIIADIKVATARLEMMPPPIEIRIVDAQQQMRTPRDVKVAWVRPKVPSKLNGRRGTRRAWKRKHPPHWLLAYREPEDVLVIDSSAIDGAFGSPFGLGFNKKKIVIATPAQAAALEKYSEPRLR